MIAVVPIPAVTAPIQRVFPPNAIRPLVSSVPPGPSVYIPVIDGITASPLHPQPTRGAIGTLDGRLIPADIVAPTSLMIQYISTSPLIYVLRASLNDGEEIKIGDSIIKTDATAVPFSIDTSPLEFVYEGIYYPDVARYVKRVGGPAPQYSLFGHDGWERIPRSQAARKCRKHLCRASWPAEQKVYYFTGSLSR